ncbi:MAG: thymidine kinase [Elusimicrobia bacterium]|nr:thymidine kinase [Elusimicrobiota bacterium]
MNKKGAVEVVTGSMFSGKTSELIRRLRLCVLARKKVQAFKSHLDDRYKNDQIVSHDGFEFEGIPARSSSQILERLTPDTQVVGIDEAQFFDIGLIDTCELMAERGIRVVVAGLDTDYRGMPFEVIAQLLARAEVVTKNLAICSVCGSDKAHYSQRLDGGGNGRVVVGAAEKYEARCRNCFVAPSDQIPVKAGIPELVQSAR